LDAFATFSPSADVVLNPSYAIRAAWDVDAASRKRVDEATYTFTEFYLKGCVIAGKGKLYGMAASPMDVWFMVVVLLNRRYRHILP
jgi:hypothetical protein